MALLLLLLLLLAPAYSTFTLGPSAGVSASRDVPPRRQRLPGASFPSPFRSRSNSATFLLGLKSKVPSSDDNCNRDNRDNGDNSDGRSPPRSLLSSYQSHLVSNPILTKSITSGVITFIGDVLSQSLSSLPLTGSISLTSLSVPRLLAFTLVGTLFVGPYLHYWYGFLHSFRLSLKASGIGIRVQPLLQIMLDQTLGVLLFFPTFYLLYESTSHLLHSRLPSFPSLVSSMPGSLLPVILMQYRVWPLINLVSFTFVPVEMRVLFSNIASLFWNVYLCGKLAN